MTFDMYNTYFHLVHVFVLCFWDGLGFGPYAVTASLISLRYTDRLFVNVDPTQMQIVFVAGNATA